MWLFGGSGADKLALRVAALQLKTKAVGWLFGHLVKSARQGENRFFSQHLRQAQDKFHRFHIFFGFWPTPVEYSKVLPSPQALIAGSDPQSPKQTSIAKHSRSIGEV